MRKSPKKHIRPSRKKSDFKLAVFTLLFCLFGLHVFSIFYFNQAVLISEKIILALMLFGIVVLWIGEIKTRNRTQARYRELQSSDEMKTKLISNVSHELRTPLTTIKEYTSILLDRLAGAVSEEQKGYLTIIQNNTSRLHRLIDNLLDISRIEAGRVRVKRQLINIGELIQKDLPTFKQHAAKKDIKLEALIPADLSSTYIDSSQISQVITNLLENAIKFTEDGGRVTIEVKDQPQQFEVSITDTGSGIAQEDFKKIFDRFHQVGRKPGSGEKGVGLGLSIAKDIVEFHRGRIWAESELGRGSKFSFNLPKYTREAYCQERITDRMRLAKDEQISLSLIMLGIDNAEEIREKSGGEAYLQTVDELEKLIRAEVRDQLDEIFKYIYLQEEVNILVLAGTELEGAFSMLRRIKKSVEGYRFNVPPLLSFGIAAYPEDAAEAEGLIRRAGQRRQLSLIKE